MERTNPRRGRAVDVVRTRDLIGRQARRERERADRTNPGRTSLQRGARVQQMRQPDEDEQHQVEEVALMEDVEPGRRRRDSGRGNGEQERDGGREERDAGRAHALVVSAQQAQEREREEDERDDAERDSCAPREGPRRDQVTSPTGSRSARRNVACRAAR